MRLAVPVLVLASLVLPPATGPAAASTAVPPPDHEDSVQVTGTGAVFGVPDVLTADFGVEADAPTVDDAMRRATTAATRMRDALLHAGVVKTDLRTSDVAINPKRNDHNDITGYTVSQGLTAKIHNLPQAGALMSTTITAGGDRARLTDVSFAIEDQAALLTEARRKAFTDAQDKADLYAHAAGRTLGRVLRIAEEPSTTYGNSFAMNDTAGAGGSAPVPIEPGRQQLTASVTVEWAINPPTRPAPKPIAPDTAPRSRRG